MSNITYFIVGIVTGVLIKVPFLWKWYRDMKKTSDYRSMKYEIKFRELVDRYNHLYPNKKYKI